MLVSPLDTTPRWFVLRTKPKQERKALDSLEARGIAGYCPRVLEPYRLRAQPKGPTPLFPGYLFARLVIGERYAAAHYCAGSGGFVRAGAQFAALEDDAVQSLKDREGERGYVVPEAPPRALRTGARVTVVGGPLAGLEGVVARFVPARRRVQVLLRHVWGGRVAEVDVESVRCA